MEKVNKLFDLLDQLNESKKTVIAAVEMLSGSDDVVLLDEEFNMVELLIVEEMGGNEGHYEYLNSAEYFLNYRFDELDREQVKDEIKAAIDNDWTGEIPITIVQG